MANDNKEVQNNNSQQRKAMPMGGMGMRVGGGKAKDFKKSMGALIRYLNKYIVIIIIALVFAALGTAGTIGGPKITEKINKIIGAYVFSEGAIPIDYSQITKYCVLLLVIYIIGAIFNYLQQFLLAGVTARTCQKMRGDISNKINKLPLRYFDSHNYGDVLSRITNDVDTVGQTLNQSLSSMISSITTIIGFIIMMLTISWELTLVALISLPVSMALMMIVIKFSQKYFKRQQASLGSLNGHIEEIYSAHNVVKIFNGTDNAVQKFDEINNSLYNSAFKSQFLSGLMMPIMNLVGNLSYVTICIIGGAMALKDPLFAASIIAFISYVRQMNQPLGQIASIANTLQSTAAAAERVFEFLAEEEQSEESMQTESLLNVTGAVEFKNVVFGYEKDKEIIHGFNCIVKPGQKVAIVGPTGAGKTTLINLLMRFYEINSGAIIVDGVPTQNMKRKDVRAMFGMVLQDTWLFEGTIKENLTFGRPEATMEEVEQASKAAKVHHFITTLPGSYDLILNEETNLSQGQKQLMTIARAMIQNAPMLILDEATSSVDTRTEVLIQEAMDELTKGRTSFVIAHRLSTIKNADIILVMKDGNIIENGNHETLMAHGGFYSELYNSQFARETSV